MVGGGHMTLKVKNKDGKQVVFRIKRNSQLKTLMNGYCVRQCIEFGAIEFVFDGIRLRGEGTPDEQGLEEGDEIHAYAMQQLSDQGAKPSTTRGGYVTLKVRELFSSDDEVVFFRMKRSTQLIMLMNGYCVRQCMESGDIYFMFDGRRLRGGETPDYLQMEEGDEIEAILNQMGC